MAFDSTDIERVKNAYPLDSKLNFIDTYIQGVRLFYATTEVSLTPMLYPSGIAIICQGKKEGFIGDTSFVYDEDTFLIVSISTPIECRTIATADKPTLGLFIDIDLSNLQNIANNLRFSTSNKEEPFIGINPVPMQEGMREVTHRLIKTLSDPIESRILGEGLKKELLYRAMISNHGVALYALIQENSSQSRISKVIQYIKQNYKEKITVQSLASLANMSPTSFHRRFKFVTGESPMQYVKKTRLSRARSLIVHEHTKANIAALEVGYDSNSQFTREFKRYYNVTPGKAKGVGYAEIDVWPSHSTV